MDTTDKILAWMEEQIIKGEIIDPTTWINHAVSLNTLLGKETDLLFDLQQEVAKLKVGYIESGDSVAKAKIKTECAEEYKLMKRQEARIERINETIRLSKIQARLRMEEYRGN